METELAISFQDTIQVNVALEGAIADQIPNLYLLDNAIDIGLVWKKDR